MDNFEELSFRYLNNGCMRDVIGSEEYDRIVRLILRTVDMAFENASLASMLDDNVIASEDKYLKPLDLTMELVPRTTWGTEVGDTLREAIGKKDWHDLREVEKEKCGNKCSICHSAKYDIEGRKPNLILHEVWNYNTSKVLRIDKPTEGEKDFGGTTTTWCEKTLINLVVICPICNGIKHFGRIYSEYKKNKITKETFIEVIDQFLIINYESGIKRKIINTVYLTDHDKSTMFLIFLEHLSHALAVWDKNSQYNWIPNFGKYSYLVKNKMEVEKLR